MKSSVLSVLLFNLLMLSICASAQEKPNATDQTKTSRRATSVKSPELREELLKRLKAARDILADLIKKYNGSIPAAELASINKIDDENTVWIKSATEKHGWLGRSLVGEDGEDAAFRIIRNATHDAEFQKLSLELLRKAVETGEAPAEQIKLLTERISEAAAGQSPPGSVINNPSAKATIAPNKKTVDGTPGQIKNPALRDELLQRIKSDQAVRLEAIKNYPSGQKLPEEVLARFKAIDQANTDWMKAKINEYGYPGFSLVGRDGEQAAFTMIQHADHDLEFQKRSLELLRRAVEQKDAQPSSLAYLTDRILTAEGKPQIYGTQTVIINGNIELKPIKDEADVDRRRAEIGLETIADYLKGLRQRYKKL